MVRMWGVLALLPCRNHFLGEHVELHMMAGCVEKMISLDGYIRKGQLDPHSIVHRHDELVIEMKRRGYKHNSPLPKHPSLFYGNLDKYPHGTIDVNANVQDLRNRCPECRKRIEEYEKTYKVKI